MSSWSVKSATGNGKHRHPRGIDRPSGAVNASHRDRGCAVRGLLDLVVEGFLLRSTLRRRRLPSD